MLHGSRMQQGGAALAGEDLQLAQQEIGALCAYVDRYRAKCNASLVLSDTAAPSMSPKQEQAPGSSGVALKHSWSVKGSKASTQNQSKPPSAKPACQKQCEMFGKVVNPIVFVMEKSRSQRGTASKQQSRKDDPDDGGSISTSTVSLSSSASSIEDSREYIENEVDSDDEMMESVSNVTAPELDTWDIPLHDRLFVREEDSNTPKKLSSAAQTYRAGVDHEVQRIILAMLRSGAGSGPLMLRDTSQSELDALPRCPDETDTDAELLARKATHFPGGYLHETARMMVKYTTASYCFMHNSANLECGCETIDKKFSVRQRFYNEQMDAYGFVGVNHEARHIVSSFRGTVSLRNWISNLQFMLVDPGRCDEFTALPPDVRLHQGFYSTYHSISRGMIDEVLKLHAECPDYTVYVTGHSLGGAMASMHAMALVLAGIPAHLIEMYTFGQPRPGNDAFSREWDARLKKGYRIVNNYDMVPHLPPHTSGFKHVGEELWFSSKLTAVQIKEYLEKNSTQRKIDVIDETGLLDMCANTTPFCRLGIVDHLLYCDRITGERRLRGARPPRNPFKSDGRIEVVSENFIQQAYDSTMNVVIWMYVPMQKCCKNKKPFKLLNEWAKNQPSLKLKVIQINTKENDLPDDLPPVGNMTVYFKPAGNTSHEDAKFYRLGSSLSFWKLRELVDAYSK
ncbi:Lipase [Porphyridium purpureum]|uniref:Lipase n=1 Tax=Porphyridium purpureum TaxID=35688 RepID=A0A5J4YT45_PORPP|nr:Lipase [Porphyridium purpureum]|eukprot:POR2575..scf236_6